LAIFNQTGKKYRNLAEVYASLLENAAREDTGVGITKLMYTSFLSYRRTTIHLEVLLKEGLLVYDKSAKLYKITSNGRQFVELYTKMAKMLEPISESVIQAPNYRALP
jgi:predicted transcriptional regulator